MVQIWDPMIKKREKREMFTYVRWLAWHQAGLLPIVVGAHSGAFDLVPYDAPEGLLEAFPSGSYPCQTFFWGLVKVGFPTKCGTDGNRLTSIIFFLHTN